MLVFIHVCLLNILRVCDICLIEIQMLPTFRQFQISKMHYACIVNIYCRYAMIINLMLKFFNFQFTDSPVNTFSKTYSISKLSHMCSFFFQSRTNRNILLVCNARALELYITVMFNRLQLNKDIIFNMP